MMSPPTAYDATPWRLLDKLVLLAALAIAVALFLTIGWMALAPTDPRGAVSLLTHRHAVLMVAQTMLLVAVTAAIATVMIGGKLPDVGVFAAALGMGFVSLQGETAAYLLINVSGGDRGAERLLAGRLAFESLVWFALLVVAMAVSGVVMRWCSSASRTHGLAEDSGSASAPPAGVGIADLAISECPVLCRLVGGAGIPADSAVARWAGLKTTAVMTIAGLLLFGVLVSGSAPQMIRHGQICFAAFAAFYLGGWFARRAFPARTAFWALLAIPLTCVLGYAWTTLRGAPVGRFATPANIPVSDFLRALPMTFVPVAALGALVAHWMIAPGTKRSKNRDRSTTASKRSTRSHGS